MPSYSKDTIQLISDLQDDKRDGSDGSIESLEADLFKQSTDQEVSALNKLKN